MDKYLEDIIFDFDGTLVDSRDGILESVSYAFSKLGLSMPEGVRIEDHIGPPLSVIFSKVIKEADEETISEAVELYREYYGSEGMYNCQTYPSVFSLIEHFHSFGCKIYIATIKPKVYAQAIIEHLGLNGMFEGVYGPELTNLNHIKTELVENIITEHDLDKSRSIIIGDKDTDIKAGHENGIYSMAVTYGYGDRESLALSKPNFIADSPNEIVTKLEKAGLIPTV